MRVPYEISNMLTHYLKCNENSTAFLHWSKYKFQEDNVECITELLLQLFLRLARPVRLSAATCVLLFRRTYLPCMRTGFDTMFFSFTTTFPKYLSTSFSSVFKKKEVSLIGVKGLVSASAPFLSLGMRLSLKPSVCWYTTQGRIYDEKSFKQIYPELVEVLVEVFADSFKRRKPHFFNYRCSYTVLQ